VLWAKLDHFADKHNSTCPGHVQGTSTAYARRRAIVNEFVIFVTTAITARRFQLVEAEATECSKFSLQLGDKSPIRHCLHCGDYHKNLYKLDHSLWGNKFRKVKHTCMHAEHNVYFGKQVTWQFVAVKFVNIRKQSMRSSSTVNQESCCNRNAGYRRVWGET